ncbi:high-affinity zinc uptake system protein ZnuA [Marinobacterium nitratireducens]|uniref:High-affinity zinc uptake system protein ZnuA n=1 Tax=Marinobacterium nitratireducens TaxID=518897 RepID=A0A917Z7U7_9GAMM|nr:zinc ABC transporter substrate-binding protein ZnuA [Marinobacterium nitratireducens]GGO77500.1 high-affinity zinc uptake system protein ZnuA [Marinobacterium nitratireducens]
MSIRLPKFLMFLTLLFPALPASALQVEASLKPLQLVAAALVDGLAEPGLLVPPEASPHHYALKPSEMRRIAAADLVIWVGPELELFLVKPLQQTEAHILQLMDGEPGADEDAHRHEGEDGHHHDVDAHIWMDPALMLEAAQKMRDALIDIAPEHGDRVAANYDRFAAALLARDKDLRQRLAPLRDRGFFVFHDAYSRFVEHYGLRQLGYFTVDPGRQPGARHLGEIRSQLADQEAVCVFSEPQFRAAVVEAVTSGTSVRHGELDPLARDIASGPDAYLLYLDALAGEFERCLNAG